LATNQYFIHSASTTVINSSSLNGSQVYFFIQNTTLGGGKITLRSQQPATATPLKGASNILSQVSSLVIQATCINFAPAVDDFIYINSNTNVNYITAVVSLGSNGYRLTLAYAETVSLGDYAYFTTPLINTASLILPSTTITAFEAENLTIYQSGSTFTYYPQITYDYFAPININVIADTCNTFSPITYSIQTPLTYSYIAPLAITDYGRTTIDFMNTETITYYNYYAVNLPNASSTYTLVGDNTIQTLTNKTLTAPTINNGTITSATINTSTLASPSITTAFTLFSNPFQYVPWTAIQTWDGGTYGTSPLASVLQNLNVQPSTNGATRIRYIYSIVGKNLYINYFFYQPNNTGSLGGSGTYYYKFPTGYTATSAVSSYLIGYDSTSIITYGTRVGTCILHTSGVSLNYGSVYYAPVVNNFLVLNREQASAGLQSSTNFQYNISGVTTFAFEVCIPLA